MDRHGAVQVLIVGAGPTGLLLACVLRRRGVACRVIDKAPEFFTGSRGKGLQPRSLELLDQLGVLEAFQARGAPYPPLRAYAGGTVVWEGRMHAPREPTPDTPHPTPLMLPQGQTEALLRERLAALGGGVESGTELAAFEQDADGVSATLVGPGGASERLRVDYLVGADGGRSLVRKRLGVRFEGVTHESDRTLIADLEVAGLERSHWHLWTEPGSRAVKAGLCPLAGTELFQLMVPLAPDEEPGQDVAALQALFDARSGRADLRLSGVRWVSLYRVNIRRVDRYRVGRVFLAGDAAHVHSPAGGQGLNTGLQDAFNLGWKLGEVLAGAPADLLDSYEAERLPVAADVLGLSTALHQGGALRSTTQPQRGDETLQLGVNYRGGPLARDERAVPGRVQAGDRAPDAPGVDAAGRPRTLFELFRGPHFTLLAFGASQAERVARLRARWGDGVRVAWVVAPGEARGDPSAFVDTGGHARAGYDLPDDALVLVRPDGYIGLVTAAPSTAPVEDYLARVRAA